MTSFVHVDYPTEHPGVVRAERVVGSVKTPRRPLRRRARRRQPAAGRHRRRRCWWSPTRSIDTWTEGHLLAAWIVMWTVAFAALALLAAPARASRPRCAPAWALGRAPPMPRGRELWASR